MLPCDLPCTPSARAWTLATPKHSLGMPTGPTQGGAHLPHHHAGLALPADVLQLLLLLVVVPPHQSRTSAHRQAKAQVGYRLGCGRRTGGCGLTTGCMGRWTRAGRPSATAWTAHGGARVSKRLHIAPVHTFQAVHCSPPVSVALTRQRRASLLRLAANAACRLVMPPAGWRSTHTTSITPQWPHCAFCIPRP